MLRVLTLTTLFPDRVRPRLGPFVERQTLGLAAHPDVELRVVAPIGLPSWPFSRHAHYAGLASLPEHEIWQGVEVFRPRFLHLPGMKGRFDAGAMARAVLPLLATLHQSFPFDVIDAEFFFPDGPAAVRLGAALGVPASIKARGSDIRFWGAQPPTGEQVVSAGRSASGLLAVSEALKADMVALGMPEDKIRVHYTGIDLDRFVPRDRAAAKAGHGIAGPLIVAVGTLMESKGQHHLIQALAELPEMQLVLIGQGPDRGRLESLVARLGLADRVRFTGSIDHEAIAAWLGAADVMCLPSVSEGLANVWLEALACGTPIVIADAGGAREVVDCPDAGRIVAAESGAIACAITGLIENPPEQDACRNVARRFSWDTNRDTLYTHLASLVSG